MGIEHMQQRRIGSAIKEYKKAIENYPQTDRYHLNETWNNLGTAYFEAEALREGERSLANCRHADAIGRGGRAQSA